jgi:hypothetical protein
MRCPIETGEGPELLLAFSSRRLDPDRTAALEGHIAECGPCAEFVLAQRGVSDALDSWEPPPVSSDFDRRLYRRIDQQVPWWDFLVRPFRPLSGARWAPVAAAAGLMIAVGLWVGHPEQTPAPPRTAQVEALPPEQAADALQEMQVMQEFSNLIHTDAPEPRM